MCVLPSGYDQHLKKSWRHIDNGCTNQRWSHKRWVAPAPQVVGGVGWAPQNPQPCEAMPNQTLVVFDLLQPVAAAANGEAAQSIAVEIAAAAAVGMAARGYRLMLSW